MEHRNDADSNSVGNKHFITFQNVLIYLETEWKQPVCVMFIYWTIGTDKIVRLHGATFWTILKIMGV